MISHESTGNRFKIWRSKQSYFVNVIISTLQAIWDIAWLLIYGIVFMAIIAVIVLWLIGLAAQSYSG